MIHFSLRFTGNVNIRASQMAIYKQLCISINSLDFPCIIWTLVLLYRKNSPQAAIGTGTVH